MVFYKAVVLLTQQDSRTNEKTSLQNQLTNLESQVSTLRSTLENKDQTINSLNSSYSELNNKYNALLEAFLQQIYPSTNYESLLNYWEVDPDNSITKTDARVSWNRMDRSLNREIWSNYVNDSNNFVHQFYFSISQIEAGDENVREMVRLWLLTSNINRLVLYAEQVTSIDNEYNLVFHQSDEGKNVFVYYSLVNDTPLKINEVYMAKITRSGDLFRLLVFSKVDQQLIIDSGLQQGLSVKFNKISLASIGGYSDDLQDWSSGYVEFLQIFN